MSIDYEIQTPRGNPQVERKREEMRLMSGAQVQNVPAARVYIFGESDLAEQDERDVELTKMSLRSRYGNGDIGSYGSTSSKEKPHEEVECFVKTITENDSLQSLALQYRCPVAELKRINNLIQDQDFYALRTIKVPLKSHGYLKEIIQKEEEEKRKQKMSQMLRQDGAIIHDTEAAEYEDEDTLYEQGPATESQSLLVRTLSIRGAMNSQSNQAKAFLDHMDKDLEKIRKSTKIRMDSLEEVTQSLKCKRIYPLTEKKSIFNGTDCGMRWWSVVAVILVVGLLLPIFYVIYYDYEKSSTEQP